MRRTLVDVTITVDVEVDETKFTPEWLADWRKVFYNFTTVEDHVEHIGQLAAREILDENFTEGYGPLSDMGIKARVVGQDTWIRSPPSSRPALRENPQPQDRG